MIHRTFTIPPQYNSLVYGHPTKQNEGARSRSDEHHDATDSSSRETHAIAEHDPTPKERNGLKRKGTHNQTGGRENSRKRKKILGDGDESESEEVEMPTSGDDQPTCRWPGCRWNKTKRFT